MSSIQCTGFAEDKILERQPIYELRRDIFARLPRTDMELLVEGCRNLREGDDGSHLLNGELSKYSGWSPLESSPVQAVAA